MQASFSLQLSTTPDCVSQSYDKIQSLIPPNTAFAMFVLNIRVNNHSPFRIFDYLLFLLHAKSTTHFYVHTITNKNNPSLIHTSNTLTSKVIWFIGAL